MSFSIILLADLMIGLSCYAWGHTVAWKKWERWTRHDLSDETKSKIYGD